ncbi:uncharacterized protein LOC130621549 isoform X2 [Hydractinia symbiolongicarpus]|uniref:uncharacterized protein LOC130621549 isoform X2 n=1 Tax=Hydractinia symbiolongicarpus TaxID=13093 RepID=UPI00254A6279|nr:uncharacterized protein LOC130621549 isoform X2 [Hydractinia symbiolongicarpus]
MLIDQVKRLSYCSNVQLKFSDTQIKRLESIDNRARILTQQNVPEIRKEIEKRAVLFVKKCLDGNVCDNFQDYFTVKRHQRTTRNNGFLLFIPKVDWNLQREASFQWV